MNGTDSNGTSRQILFWLLGSLLTLVLFLGGFVVSDNRDRISNVEGEMRERSSDRYHGSDAARDFALRDRVAEESRTELKELRRRIEDLERGRSRR